jgi:thiamine monophosphate kinase
MKVGQKTIVRWMSKVAAKGAIQSAYKQSVTKLRELDVEQLRHVSGGDGISTQLPKGTW